MQPFSGALERKVTQWSVLLPTMSLLPKQLSETVAAHKLEEVKIWHIFQETSASPKIIVLPANFVEIVKTDHFIQLMGLVYRMLGYIPMLHPSETYTANTWSEEQKQIIQGLGLWLQSANGLTYTDNIRKGYRRGYMWAARTGLPFTGEQLRFCHVIHENPNLSQLLFGVAWAKVQGQNMALFESHIKTSLNNMIISPAVAQSWIQSPEMIKTTLCTNFIWKGNKQFSIEEQKFLDMKHNALIEKINSIKVPSALEQKEAARSMEFGKEHLLEFLNYIVELQHASTRVNKNVEPVMGHRISVFLGKNKREQAKNKIKSREIRFLELKQEDEFWNAFQPNLLCGLPPFRTATPSLHSASEAHEWKNKHCEMFDAYLSAHTGTIDLSIDPLVRSWWLVQYPSSFI